MIAAGDVTVEEQAVQRRLAGNFDPSLFLQFALQGIAERFAYFHAAAGQVPTADIAVLDQKYPIFTVEHDGADPERHAARESPIEMKNPPQRRLKAPSQVLQVHRHGNPWICRQGLILASRRPACQYIPGYCRIS